MSVIFGEEVKSRVEEFKTCILGVSRGLTNIKEYTRRLEATALPLAGLDQLCIAEVYSCCERIMCEARTRFKNKVLDTFHEIIQNLRVQVYPDGLMDLVRAFKELEAEGRADTRRVLKFFDEATEAKIIYEMYWLKAE